MTGGKIFSLVLRRVEFMPEKMEPGIIYVSEKFGSCIHLCACGWCGQETVTPFTGQDDWKLEIDDSDRVTLTPSVGNFQMPCGSHYWIRNGEIVWI